MTAGSRLADAIATTVVAAIWAADDARERLACRVLGPRCPRCHIHVFDVDRAEHLRKDCNQL